MVAFTKTCTTGILYIVLTHKGKNYKVRGIVCKRVLYRGKTHSCNERMQKNTQKDQLVFHWVEFCARDEITV